jgi:hypothetical protein
VAQVICTRLLYCQAEMAVPQTAALFVGAKQRGGRGGGKGRKHGRHQNQSAAPTMASQNRPVPRRGNRIHSIVARIVAPPGAAAVLQGLNSAGHKKAPVNAGAGKAISMSDAFMNIGLVVSSRLLGSLLSPWCAQKWDYCKTCTDAVHRGFPAAGRPLVVTTASRCNRLDSHDLHAQEATACAHLQNRSLQRIRRLWRLDGDQFAHGISPRCSDFWMPPHAPSWCASRCGTRAAALHGPPATRRGG